MTALDLDAVTFDCWGTLIFDHPKTERGSSYDLRVAALARIGDLSIEDADELLQQAWAHHFNAWHEMRGYGAPGMAEHCLAALRMLDDRRLHDLTVAFEEASIEFGVGVVAGASDALEEVRRRGLRTALVCDTGFTPGRVVRTLLADKGMAEMLDVMAFSDEVGVPKPHARMFTAALDGIGVAANRAAHVGDLRRTDVAGARAAGMGTVRFAGVYDDDSDLPDADVVITSYDELPAFLPSSNGTRSSR
jgi:putative hydrolase of the HAD superfamily